MRLLYFENNGGKVPMETFGELAGKEISVPAFPSGKVCAALLEIDNIPASEDLLVCDGLFSKSEAESVLNYAIDSSADVVVSLLPRKGRVHVSEDMQQILEIEAVPPYRGYAYGCYLYFKKANDFFDALKRMTLKGNITKKKDILLFSVNELILLQKKVAPHFTERTIKQK